MGKIIVIPQSKEMLKLTINDVDGYIIGIKNLSINIPFYYSLEEIEKVINYLKENNKEIFVSLNKNYFNNDLEHLKKALAKLNKLEITGVLFYDLAVVHLNKNLNLVWNQEHFTTNYNTINYWADLGVNATLLSSELTIGEIKEIINKTNSKLMINVFGHVPIFTSVRNLVNNYLNYFKKPKTNNLFYMEFKEKYPIINDKLGTFVYSPNVLNLIEETILFKKHINYLILNSFNIPENKFLEILKLFKNVNESNVQDYSNKITKLIPNNDKGFLYKKIIYKVKKNE